MSARRRADEAHPSIVPLLWTAADCAAALQVSVDTLARWRAREEGPRAVKLGKLVSYRPADVQAWVDTLEDLPPSTYRVEGVEE